MKQNKKIHTNEDNEDNEESKKSVILFLTVSDNKSLARFKAKTKLQQEKINTFILLIYFKENIDMTR